MALAPQRRIETAALAAGRSAWLAAGLALLAAAAALIAAFWREAEGAYEVWTGSTAYNHCFLILPVALYLAWQRRALLDRIVPEPDLRAVALVLPLSLLWLVAARLSLLELQQLIVLAMFEALALAVLGGRAFRALLAPLLYLFFLVPTGYFLVPTLQNFTAWFAVGALRLVGVPVYWDGTLIEVPAGNFVVAEACAGLRFLIASLAFGVFFAVLFYRSRLRWLAFIALSVVVPIIANGLRAFGIIGLAELTGNAAAVEADHIIYGWGFFTAVTLVLILIGLGFADDRRPAATAAPAVPVRAAPARPWAGFVAAALGLMLAVSGPAYAELRYPDRAGAPPALASVALPRPPWHALPAATYGWTPVVKDADREFLTTYGDGRETVVAYVALYANTGLHNNLVRGMNEIADPNRWGLAASRTVRAAIAGKTENVAETVVEGGGRRLTIWHFYVVGDRVAASAAAAKLLQLRGLFGGTGGTDAFVAVAADASADDAHPEAALRDFLATMPLP